MINKYTQSTFITNHSYACKLNSHIAAKNKEESVWWAVVNHPFATRSCTKVSTEEFKNIPHEKNYHSMLAKFQVSVYTDDTKPYLKPEHHNP